jgi:hypothetical protein
MSINEIHGDISSFHDEKDFASRLEIPSPYYAEPKKYKPPSSNLGKSLINKYDYEKEKLWRLECDNIYQKKFGMLPIVHSKLD